MMMSSLLLFAGMLMVVSCQPSSHKITSLPGLQNSGQYTMYAGYFPAVDGDMFYWFIESANNPATDPLVLWLNGGPGCSSLLGLISENGPFSPDANNNLVPNPYSWHQVANVLYLESPPGVGFSKAWNSSLVYDDAITAADNYQFLKNWFAAYPSFKQNPFWVTGESYGGHYVPTLVDLILQGLKKFPLNFKGFAVGNPYTSEQDFGSCADDYLVSHGLDSLISSYNTNHYGDIDPYDILVDVCTSGAGAGSMRKYADHITKQFNEHRNKSTNGKTKRYVPNPPACIDDYVTSYLNQPAVQKAIHAKPTSWQECGGPNYAFGDYSVVPLYQKFLTEDISIMVYSGDADTVIPFLCTEAWVIALESKPISKWKPWVLKTQQVGGYYISFSHITYVTIKGAGHMVPWYQPEPALEMITNFLTGSW